MNVLMQGGMVVYQLTLLPHSKKVLMLMQIWPHLLPHYSPLLPYVPTWLLQTGLQHSFVLSKEWWNIKKTKTRWNTKQSRVTRTGGNFKVNSQQESEKGKCGRIDDMIQVCAMGQRDRQEKD